MAVDNFNYVIPSHCTVAFVGSSDSGKTIILVAHDADEALRVADEVGVLRVHGSIAQAGTLQEIVAAPQRESTTSSARLRAPAFLRRFETWNFTVFTLMASSAAIS